MEFTNYDKNYTDHETLNYINNVFIQILYAITNNKLDSIEHFVSDSVYQQIKTKLDELKEKGQYQKYDETNVKSTTIVEKIVEGEYFIIKVDLVSRALDYIVDENDEIVFGNDFSRKEILNHLVFKKKINAKDDDIINKCPNCGASIDININGKCPYCRMIFDMENHGWILTEWSI